MVGRSLQIKRLLPELDKLARKNAQNRVTYALFKEAGATLARNNFQEIPPVSGNLVSGGLYGARCRNKEAFFKRFFGRKSARLPGGGLVDQTIEAGKKSPGLVKGMLRRVAAPAAVLGTGYALYKGGKGLVNLGLQAAQQPPAYGHGVRQFQYGYTPDGQAQF